MLRIRGQLPRLARASRSISTVVVENSQPVSELSLVVKAGSRYEPAPGVAHLLQRFAFKDTPSRSGLRLQREAELLGGQLSTQLSREHIVLTAKFLREDLPYFVEALGDTVSNPLFKAHEFTEEVIPLALAEAKLARSVPKTVAVEKAHEAAFRSGLGNPLLVTPEFVPDLDTVKGYAAQAYTRPQTSLFARNVVEEDLAKFAGTDFSTLAHTSAITEASKPQFFGGNTRTESSHATQTAVLAFPTTVKPCLQALKYVLGGRNVKWSKSFGLLNTLGVSSSVHHKVYEDAALFYVVLQSSSAEKVTAAAKEAASIITKLGSGVDSTLASKALATAKFAATEKQNTLHGYLKPALDVSKSTPETIAAAAKALAEGPKVLSVVGKTYALPYVEELF